MVAFPHGMRRPLPLFVALFLVGCAARGGGRASTARVDDEYALAVRRAAVVEQSQIVNDLQPLDRANASLVWSADGSRVLALTWKSQSTYERFFRNQTQTSPDEANVVWVTLAPQVQRFCQNYLHENPKATDADVILRLKQYLGLNASRAYDVFLEMWIDPAEVFRPCVDPEPTDSTCNLEFAPTPPVVKGIANYPAFYKNLYFDDFRTPPGIPWTGLGYTYDWGNPRSREGASEFILVPGARYEIRHVVPTAQYCRAAQ
jgi:hypothetical protein